MTQAPIVAILLWGWTLFLPLHTHDTLEGVGAQPSATLKGCGGCSLAEMQKVRASWSYVWHPRPPAGVLPLVKPDYHSVSDLSPGALAAGWVLFSNEPDLEGPSPKRAAELYPEAEALGVKLVLATGSQLDESLYWVKGFRKEYRQLHGHNPRINALAAHCYFDPSIVGWCIRHVGNVVRLARSWGVGQVWVTEWACLPGTAYSMEECLVAWDTFIGWMEATPAVARYAIFGARIDPSKPWNGGSSYNSLFGWCEPFGLTEWGRQYRRVP